MKSLHDLHQRVDPVENYVFKATTALSNKGLFCFSVLRKG